MVNHALDYMSHVLVFKSAVARISNRKKSIKMHVTDFRATEPATWLKIVYFQLTCEHDEFGEHMVSRA